MVNVLVELLMGVQVSNDYQAQQEGYPGQDEGGQYENLGAGGVGGEELGEDGVGAYGEHVYDGTGYDAQGLGFFGEGGEGLEGFMPPRPRRAGSKTRLCQKFREPGGCFYGEHCKFANSETEISRPSWYKTQLCHTFEDTGSCPFGDECHYAHSRAQLRSDTHARARETTRSLTHAHANPCTGTRTHAHAHALIYHLVTDTDAHADTHISTFPML